MNNKIEYFGYKVRQEGKALCTYFISAQVMGISNTALYYSEGGKQGIL
jgi:hypothetical protein